MHDSTLVGSHQAWRQRDFCNNSNTTGGNLVNNVQKLMRLSSLVTQSIKLVSTNLAVLLFYFLSSSFLSLFFLFSSHTHSHSLSLSLAHLNFCIVIVRIIESATCTLRSSNKRKNFRASSLTKRAN